MTIVAGSRERPLVGLPREHYVSPEIYELELERIFRTGWRFVCHQSQIAGQGAWVRYDLGVDSLIVVRRADGSIVAHHNVCRHRGSPIVTDDAGVCRNRFVCPYHGWSYELDGSLRGTPKMPKDFDPAPWPLKRAWVDVWNGFVFVSLADERPPGVAERVPRADFSNYLTENLRVYRDNEVIVEANWKVLWENGLECYHCTLNHPEFAAVVDVDDYGDQMNRTELAEYDYIPERPLLPGVVRQGGGISIRRDGSYANGSTAMQWHLGIFELFMFNESVFAGSFRPVGPLRTAVRIMGLVHEDADEGDHFNGEEIFALSELTRRQDDRLCELVQKGMLSNAYEPGPFNEELEAANQAFVWAYLKALRA
jgi:Rieske 2Fe-2S family protein